MKDFKKLELLRFIHILGSSMARTTAFHVYAVLESELMSKLDEKIQR
jgi:hypothetical protein